MSQTKDPKATPPGIRDPARRTIINPTFNQATTFRKYSYETNGEYTLLEDMVNPGGGNPQHYHTSYTETFQVSQGQLGVEIEGITTILNPGDKAVVPIGIVHRFFNPSQDEECRFTVELRPGNEGFEKFMYILFGLVRDGLSDEEGIPKDKSVLALILDLGDVRQAGFSAALMNPMIKGIAGYKRWRGVQAKLLERYWFS